MNSANHCGRRSSRQYVPWCSTAYRHLHSLAIVVPALCLNLCAVRAIAAETKHPNMVLIIADDLRFDLLRCNGHPHAQTSSIDRLAQQGANLTNFLAVTPLCSPSRATFLTGLYPHSHRIVNNDDQGVDVKSHRLMTFPRILREVANYRTAYIGKWHMGFDDSRRPGFDHWISFKGQGQFIDPVVNLNGQRIQTDGYLTDLINQWAREYLQQASREPFCLIVSHEAAHRPFLPAKRHERLHRNLQVDPIKTDPEALVGKRALRRDMPARSEPSWFRPVDASPEPSEPRRGRPETFEEIVRDQLRCLASIDDGVGQILDVLDERKLTDNTIVIFTSDHGFLHGEFGQTQGKRWPYDPCLRVPFIIRYPGVTRPNAIVTQMAASIDLVPTLLEWAGVTWHAEFHGRTLTPLLENPEAAWRDSLLLEYFVERVAPRCPQYFAVRTDQWKYIHYPALDGMDELYHLAEDPQERINVIDEPNAQDALIELKQELQELCVQTENPFPVLEE